MRRTAGLCGRRMLGDVDLVAVGAVSMLAGPFGGDSTPAPRRLIAQIVAAVQREPARFVVATPEQAHTVATAAQVAELVLSPLFGDAVVTVVDLHRSTPLVVAALHRLTGAAG